MGEADAFAARSRAIAMRFLQTAVVVDDQAVMSSSRGERPPATINVPDRHARGVPEERLERSRRPSEHNLDARPLVDAFARVGVICGVVSPDEASLEVVRQADIVVLDWRLDEDDLGRSLDLLLELVAEVDRNSLRLVSFYTGEAELDSISEKVFEGLQSAELRPVRDAPGLGMSYRHGRVVFYAKPDVSLVGDLARLRVVEKDLAERLVRDFTDMTEGLLPHIALTSLAAVRECAHKVLDRFNCELDPAFMAHRASLPNPAEAERQIVSHVAEEVRGLMDDAVSAVEPAGRDAVEGWLRRSNGEAPFKFGDRCLDFDQTVRLANGGLKASQLSDSAFRHLTAGFAGGEATGLDERLAWIMSSRTVFNAPPPTLWLGSVVTAELRGKRKHLICMRPRCDSVRLNRKGGALFLFLPLVDPAKRTEQVVVRVGEEYVRLSVGMDPSGWVLRKFRPLSDQRPVVAQGNGVGGGFVFVDASRKRFTWRGELKSEYAQRVAQTFASTMGRVAVDESEWLRRSAGRA